MKKQVKAWLPDSGWSLRPLFGGMIAGLLALMSVLPAQAGIVAENDAVTALMTSTAGTANDPSVYLFDNYVKDFLTANLYIGGAAGSEWVILRVVNGSQVTTTGTLNGIGAGTSSTTTLTNGFCTVEVSGTGSGITWGSTRLGGRSSNNKLLIADGASASFTGQLYVGYYAGADSTNNVIVVDDATLNMGVQRLRFGYEVGNNFNKLIVQKGGVVTTDERIEVRYGSNEEIIVKDEGSSITLTGSSTALQLAGSNVYCHHNTLTVADGGVVKLSNSGGTLVITQNSVGGCGVRFAAGIFAVAGNRPTHLTYDKAWLWDGDSWEQAPSNWVGTYYADETAATAAGRPGFGGYTVFTGGKSIAGALKTTLVVVK